MKNKQAFFTFAVLLFATLLLASCEPACPECIEDTGPLMPSAQCVGFRVYGPGHIFANPYEQQEFIFTSETGPPEFETVSLNNLSGLAIESNGLRVDLPVGTDKVWIQSAVPKSATELNVIAIDDQKNTIHEAIIPNDATLHQITITPKGSDVFHVAFNGGDGEALLIEVCINDQSTGTPSTEPAATTELSGPCMLQTENPVTAYNRPSHNAEVFLNLGSVLKKMLEVELLTAGSVLTPTMLRQPTLVLSTCVGSIPQTVFLPAVIARLFLKFGDRRLATVSLCQWAIPMSTLLQTPPPPFLLP